MEEPGKNNNMLIAFLVFQSNLGGSSVILPIT